MKKVIKTNLEDYPQYFTDDFYFGISFKQISEIVEKKAPEMRSYRQIISDAHSKNRLLDNINYQVLAIHCQICGISGIEVTISKDVIDDVAYTHCSEFDHEVVQLDAIPVCKKCARFFDSYDVEEDKDRRCKFSIETLSNWSHPVWISNGRDIAIAHPDDKARLIHLLKFRHFILDYLKDNKDESSFDLGRISDYLPNYEIVMSNEPVFKLLDPSTKEVKWYGVLAPLISYKEEDYDY